MKRFFKIERRKQIEISEGNLTFDFFRDHIAVFIQDSKIFI